MNNVSENDLERFLKAQEYDYATARWELRNGKKRSHWIWYIFPQLRGLGSSRYSHYYGISGIEEAKAYLLHPILSERLLKLSEILLSLDETDPVCILGEIDARKLQSSMTLFSAADPENEVFRAVLTKFYGGETDPVTLRMLNERE